MKKPLIILAAFIVLVGCKQKPKEKHSNTDGFITTRYGETVLVNRNATAHIAPITLIDTAIIKVTVESYEKGTYIMDLTALYHVEKNDVGLYYNAAHSNIEYYDMYYKAIFSHKIRVKASEIPTSYLNLKKLAKKFFKNHARMDSIANAYNKKT